MGLTGQIAVSSPREEVKLFFDTGELSQAVSEAENGDQITLYAGTYGATTSSALNDLNVNNGKSEVFVVALPGADLDYGAIDDDRLPQISDLNRLATLDDILEPIDNFFPPQTGGDGQTVYYDASSDRLKFTDVMVVDSGNDEVKVNDRLITQDDVEIASESEPSVKTRLNLLENLLPSAPELDSYNFVIYNSGKLGYGPSSSIGGVENVPNRDIADAITTGDSISTTDYQGNSITVIFQGILDQFDSNPNGTLNPGVSSTANHDADVFGRAEEGELIMRVNENEIVDATADLSNSGAINTISGGATATGFDLSASSPLKFADGSNFSGVHQRTGTWQVDIADLQSGFNKIRVEHFDENSQLISETTTIGYILDDEGTSISFSGLQWTGLSTSGSSFLSGIERFTQATATVNATASNVYLYTYSSRSDAVTYPTQKNFTDNNFSIDDPNNSGDDFDISRNVASDEIVFNEGFEAAVDIKDPVESSATSNTFSNWTFLIDDSPNNNTDTDQRFDAEDRRLTSDLNFANNHSGNWDSSKSIKDGGDTGYNDSLQCRINPVQTGHRLEYPQFDYSGISEAPSGNPDYSIGTNGIRTFFGYFTDSTSTSNFSLNIYGSATLVSFGQASTSTDEVEIGIKLPGQTAWLDINEDFVQGNINTDGDGAFQAVNGNTKQIDPSNSKIGITTGTAPTSASFDKLYYRVKAPNQWSGHINRININWPET